jgi:hypothetical protein
LRDARDQQVLRPRSEHLRRNRGFGPIDKGPGVVDERAAKPIHIEFDYDPMAGAPIEADFDSRAASRPGLRPLFSLGQDALGDEVASDCRKGCIAEARGHGKPRARHRPEAAQGRQDKTTILPADEVRVGYRPHHSLLGPTLSDRAGRAIAYRQARPAFKIDIAQNGMPIPFFEQ